MRLTEREKSMIIRSLEMIEERLRPSWGDFIIRKKERKKLAEVNQQLIDLINKLTDEWSS